MLLEIYQLMMAHIESTTTFQPDYIQQVFHLDKEQALRIQLDANQVEILANEWELDAPKRYKKRFYKTWFVIQFP